MRRCRLFLLAAGLLALLAAPVRAACLPLLSDGQMSSLSASEDPTLFGLDDRQEAADSTRLPYSAVCKLLITYQNGTHGEGTGFIYGENVLATAGHVLYDESGERGGTPLKIEIIPGAKEEQRPFGSYLAVPGENSCFYTPERWRTRRDWRYDYGVIALQTAFSPEAGMLDLGHYEDYSEEALKNTKLSILGYDAGSFSPLLAQGNVQQVRPFDLLYQIGILPGQSGAPVVDADNQVVAIQNYGVSLNDGERALRWNSGARLNKTAYRFLSSCRSQSALS
ncbi:MAG: hypothetical protein HFG27_06685 [Provencibacterium sp.]|nr:hypothetical protein [Provencibacterium sp.]